MAEVFVAALALLRHPGAHFETVVAVKGVAFDVGRGYFFAPEDILEGLLHRSRAGPR